MDQSSTARVNDPPKQKSSSVTASVLLVVLMITGNVVHAAAQEPDTDSSIDHSGRKIPPELNGSFSTLYEPSGIAPLPDGRFLIVEDEPNRALRLVTADVSTNDAISFKDETSLKLPSSLTARLSVGVLDDLEGAAHDKIQRFYVISSHDDSAPYWSSKRQKLLRFSILDGRMQGVLKKHTLRRDLLDNYPELAIDAQGKSKKKAAVMNIEALAYDRSRDVLLIGLRAPVLNGKAIIIRLMNPDDYMNGVAQPDLDETLWSVDLDKGGLRAMTYDDQTDQLLLVSRREDHKNDSYKLWRLSADGRKPAVRIEVGDQEDMLDSVEGLVPISLDSSSGSGVLFVRDNGNEKKGRGGDWFILTRQQLGLDSELR